MRILKLTTIGVALVTIGLLTGCKEEITPVVAQTKASVEQTSPVNQEITQPVETEEQKKAEEISEHAYHVKVMAQQLDDYMIRTLNIPDKINSGELKNAADIYDEISKINIYVKSTTLSSELAAQNEKLNKNDGMMDLIIKMDNEAQSLLKGMQTAMENNNTDQYNDCMTGILNIHVNLQKIINEMSKY